MSRTDKISLPVVIYIAYMVTIPANQILNFSGNGTITKYIGILAMVLAFAEILVKKRGKIEFQLNGISKSFLLMMAYYVVIMPFSYSIERTIGSLFSLCTLFALLMIMSMRTWNEKEKSLLIFSMVVSGALFAIYLIAAQELGGRSTFANSLGREANENTLGLCLALSGIIAIERSVVSKRLITRIIWLVSSVVIAIGILSTGSRTSAIGFVISIVVLVIMIGRKNKRLNGKVIFKLALFFMAIYFILKKVDILNEATLARFVDLQEMEGASGRETIWKSYLDMMFDDVKKILIGCGYAGERTAYYTFYGIVAPAVHNDFLAGFMYGGIVGFILYVVFIINVFWFVINKKNLLGVALFIMLVIAGLSGQYFPAKEFWNILMFIFIGIGNCCTSASEQYGNKKIKGNIK